MRMRALMLALTALFASFATGQTSTPPDLVVRVFTFNQADTPNDIREMANTVRTVAGMNIAPDTAQRAVSLRGNADQVTLADWLLNQLDQPASPSRETAEYDYQAGKPDTAVRVFRLAHTDTTQGFQEIGNAIRVVAEVNRLLVCNAPRALVMRGTAGQATLADWLVGELDQPAGEILRCPRPRYGRRRVSGAGQRPGGARLHLAQTTTPQQLSDITNKIRTATQMSGTMPCSLHRVLAVAGTAAQIARAQQLIQEMK